MSTTTTNLNMVLNEGQDKFSIPTLNENLTKIDTAIGEQNKNLSTFSEQFTVSNLKRVHFDIDTANSYLAINFMVTDTLKFILTIEGNNKKIRLIKSENGTNSTIFNIQGQ